MKLFRINLKVLKLHQVNLLDAQAHLALKGNIQINLVLNYIYTNYTMPGDSSTHMI